MTWTARQHNGTLTPRTSKERRESGRDGEPPNQKDGAEHPKKPPAEKQHKKKLTP